MLNLWVSQNIFLLLVYRCELVRPSLYQNKIKTGIILKWDNKNNYLSQDKSSQVKSEWDKYILLEYKSWNIARKSPWKVPWKAPWKKSSEKVMINTSGSPPKAVTPAINNKDFYRDFSDNVSVSIWIHWHRVILLFSPLKVLRLSFCWNSIMKPTSR